jgi:3-oxoacyl-[acyl-carrier protein] reductase
VVQAGIMPIDMAVASADHIPAAVLHMHSIRRIATLNEVAGSVIHLAGPDAGYIMGSIIDVSGGVLSASGGSRCDRSLGTAAGKANSC